MTGWQPRTWSRKRYINASGITGLTSNPSIFEQALAGGAYSASVRALEATGLKGEDLLFELALEDLTQAADPSTQFPGTPEGLRAVEEAIFGGMPVNVTLLSSREHYLAAADAYMRGLERRLAAGRHVRVASVASLYFTRWDVDASADKPRLAPPLHQRLGIATAMCAYRAHREGLASDRWQRLAAAGARPQRLLWTSTGCQGSVVLVAPFLQALAAPETIPTLPETTGLAQAEPGRADAGRDKPGSRT